MGDGYRPTTEEQKAFLQMNLSRSLTLGDTWYLISLKWLKLLKEYLGLMGTNGGRAVNPGPIDNSQLLRPDNTLQKNLTDSVHYDLVPENAWNYLVGLYGIEDGQSPIPRKVIESEPNYKVVEIYPIEVQCSSNYNMDPKITIEVSRQDTFQNVLNRLLEVFKVDWDTETRLWIRHPGIATPGSSFTLTEDWNATIVDLGICEDIEFVLETKNSTGWSLSPESGDEGSSTGATGGLSAQPSKTSMFSFSTQASGSDIGRNFNDNGSLSSARSSFSGERLYRQSTPPEMKIPGLCGLNNIGNTCYMNSVIQCLSNSPPITEYFLSKKHLEEINPTNPLGTKGLIAKAFGNLIDEMWSSEYSHISPLQFKTEVGKLNPYFAGCQQHDSSELLVFMLDGIHEDVNRVRDKPYLEVKDIPGRDDQVVAEEQWDYYKRRNDSIIVDTFHGLLKSKVVCPECEGTSVTFDPFSNLPLPLPISKERIMTILHVPYSPSEREKRYKLSVPIKGTIRDLCQVLSTKAKVNPTNLNVAEVHQNHFRRFYCFDESVDQIDEKDTLYIYEIPNASDDSVETMILPIYFWERVNSDDQHIQKQLFGTPLILSIPKCLISLDQLRQILIAKIRRHFTFPEIPDRDETMEHNSATEEVKEPLFNIYVNDLSWQYPLPLDDSEDGLKRMEEIFGPDDSMSDDRGNLRNLLLEFSTEKKQEFFKEILADYDHLYYATSIPRERTKLSVKDCLDLYVNREKLSADDAWFCPSCKKRQRASKKLDLWRLPKMLIISLKRFSYNKYRREKIDALVEFPITDLDMRGYVMNPNETRRFYDLVAVCNHYGNLGSGHYTAYCKNKESGKWYRFDDQIVSPISETDVLTEAAYVLFYIAKDAITPPKVQEK